VSNDEENNNNDLGMDKGNQGGFILREQMTNERQVVVIS